ncbi:cell division control protein 14 [Lepidopterella palustris CBS 459.81]|uniref:Cell division control protein 14 n=1 Tax=Lepidopterella palustris CBS 459.81 TaxID=1314670 RepID=A0A8E2JEL4_9PEZI|nr:cell division control protein 14 [Lepidopterella palustris CBS 459.81]
MEALLSLSFDNIASKDSAKIRKGLRQIEGLLAQICLSNSNSKSSAAMHKRRASAIALNQPQESTSPKKLGALTEDPAFREFFRLQEGFEWNVAIRIVACLERLLGMSSSGQNDLLILSALSNLQGILLLHPPSRTIFSREIYMNLLLDLLDPYNCPAIQSSTLLVLVTTLLSTPQNTRTFESIDGLLTITSLFKSRSTVHTVRLKLLEFIYFYLMPETPTIASASAPNTAMGLQRSPSKLLGAFERRNSTHSGADCGGGFEEGRHETKTTEEKQTILGRYLSNVEDLVQDLRENAPFAEMTY